MIHLLHRAFFVALSFVVLLSAAAASPSKAGPFSAGPTLSGSWFDPARSGEGIVLQLLPDGTAFAFWFTYAAVGESGEQAWLLAADGRIDGDTIRFGRTLRPRGGRFGAAFDPAAIEYVDWGQLELQFANCTTAMLRYSGPPGYGSGERRLSRLTTLDEVDCNGARDLLPSGARAFSGLRARSGAWYVPTRSGEGWIVEELADGHTGVYWFTYDPNGRQAWMIGLGRRNGDRLQIDEVWIAGGTRFGSAFDPAAVELRPWGRMTLRFSGCNTLDVDYSAHDPAYGAANRRAQRLTRLAGAPCLDERPLPPGNARWVERARMPVPYPSEHSATALDGLIYTLGGFGDPRGFKRYDPATNQWSTLPGLPDARHHLSAFALDGGVFMVGGQGTRDTRYEHSAYRYDVARGVWEPRPALPAVAGSHAAVLNGRAYVGDATGVVYEYDPRHHRVRQLPPPPFAERRDHSQLVAFLDELWLIGGRGPDGLGPEIRQVAIYDPIAELWRVGPSLAQPRGGFAAAATEDRIVVAGGEIVYAEDPFTLDAAEWYFAGSDTWSQAPRLPEKLHGVPGAAVGARVFVLGGSTLGGDVRNTGRVFELQW